jgi:hypothetical protein
MVGDGSRKKWVTVEKQKFINLWMLVLPLRSKDWKPKRSRARDLLFFD